MGWNSARMHSSLPSRRLHGCSRSHHGAVARLQISQAASVL
jgi:hypothetical protein